MKIDILAFGAHPDDVELGCAGTLLAHISKGKSAGIIDLTQGELSTRGTVEIRNKEALSAAKILGINVRENLKFEDGFFSNDKHHQIEVIKTLRKYRPEIVITNAPYDRHPDHGRASALVSDACFLAGLKQIHTKLNTENQQPHRPRFVMHYIQYRNIKPDFIVDISDYFDRKMESIKAHKSQFYDPESNEPETVISAPDFLEAVVARARVLGKQIGIRYGEGFTVDRYIGIKNLFDLI